MFDVFRIDRTRQRIRNFDIHLLSYDIRLDCKALFKFELLKILDKYLYMSKVVIGVQNFIEIIGKIEQNCFIYRSLFLKQIKGWL